MENKSRRKFIQNTLTATVALTVGAPLLKSQSAFAAKNLPNAFQFAQIKLPYSYAALEPSIDALTMEIHYSKHHTAYIKNLNTWLISSLKNL